MKVDFVGLKLDNPVIVAAGPWARDGKSIRRLIEAGAGAVVTESIVSDTLDDVSPRIAYDGRGAQNIRLYSDIQVEGWEHEMEIAKSAGGKVIASVSANTPSEAAYIASKLERYGADAIEISISNPAFEGMEVAASRKEVVADFTKEVVDSVKLPVLVKLSQTATNIVEIAGAAKDAGASGISSINTIRCILGVDIEEMEPALPTYGGYSGAPIRPISLAAVASIAQSVDIPVCGIGGIENYKNVLEYIMLGASAVQVGTAVMVNGPGVITDIVNDLDKWLASHKITDISQIKGQAMRKLKSFDEMKIEPAYCQVNEGRCEDGCRLCVDACMYGAITKSDHNVTVNISNCYGCGICKSICPIRKLTLERK